MPKKPKTGYEKKKVKKKKKEHYIGRLLVSNPKKVSLNEKIVKFLIYIALRLVIRPKKWKDPKKNYEIIDRTYERIMSADFIFIPSSIAFYLIMAFMPILSLILFLYQIDGINHLLTKGHFSEVHISWVDSSGAIQGHDVTSSLDPLREANDWVAKQNFPATFNVKIGEPTNWIVTQDLLSDILGKFIPGMTSIINQMSTITNGSSNNAHAGALTATLLSLIASTWIAAGGFSKLVFTQSYMYDHKFVGGYWMNKFKGMFMVVVFSIALFAALAINIVVAKWVESMGWSDVGKDVFNYFFLAIGLIIGVFGAFLALFKLSPRYAIKVKNIIPGTMVSTIPTAGFLILFGSISSLWSYGNYGVVGTIMYLGMGSLLITYFIFVGLSVNVAYYKTFVGSKLRTKWTVSKK